MPKRKAGLPVMMKPLSGNACDSGSFPELIDRHVEHLQNAHGFDYVVADSSLYNADHVEELTESGVKFARAGTRDDFRSKEADSGGGDRVDGST